MRKFYLHPSFSTRADNLVIILGGRQFTIYEDYYVEQNVNITETDPRNDILTCTVSEPAWGPQGKADRPPWTESSVSRIPVLDGYLWFVQYDNHKEITLEDFRLFMDGITLSRLNSDTLESNGGFNFNDAVNYIGVSFSDIPKIGFWFLKKMGFFRLHPC